MTYATAQTDLLIYRQYEYRGMKFIVKINRLKKTASFVEYFNDTFEPKRWLFADRELRYMNGWLLILEGMQAVIKDVKRELQIFKDEDTEKLIKVMLQLDKVKEDL